MQMNTKKRDIAKELIDDLLSDDSAVTAPVVETSIKADETVSSVPDPTVKLSASKIATVTEFPQTIPNIPTKTNTTIKTSVGKIAVKSTGLQGATEAQLLQSENIRIAQQKVIELEEAVEKLKLENEKMAAASEAIRRQAQELQTEVDQKERLIKDNNDSFKQEREILEGAIRAKEKENKELKYKTQEYENRLNSNLQKIRVRERELENRLELVKMESQAVNKSKDDIFIDLKRQIDQLNLELEKYRAKTQELNRQVGQQDELVRRTVKALRLALTMLEGGPVDKKDTGT